jgi:uridine kinase
MTCAFSFDSFQEYLRSYFGECENNKPRAVHHSEKYREKEKPAYRVISGNFTRLVPILEALAGKNSGVIAIDGRAASGKSTLAENLQTVIGAEIICMDDFFLPADLRTASRLNEPGGNAHYERFLTDVIPNVSDTKNSFEYKIFDCGIMDYRGVRKIKPSMWRVVEGSYSHHPALGEYMNLRVFSHIDAKTQIERITARNGKNLADMFKNQWIPMEEKYFLQYEIKEKSQVII